MLARITCIAKRHHARADGGPDADADADADKDGTGELNDADEGGGAAAFASDAALESPLFDGRMICCKYDDQLDRVDSADDELVSAAAVAAAAV